jgi:hypothetical protein
MEHKAYAFDWTRFGRGLRPTFDLALYNDHPDVLEAYIDRHWRKLTDPYEGEPLTEDWRELLEAGDVQELADFAMTRYYQVRENCGIGYSWMQLSEELPEPIAAALLGYAYPIDNATFDPGRMGAYFQCPGDVRRSLKALRGIRRRELQGFRKLLERCVKKGKGLYVTF